MAEHVDVRGYLSTQDELLVRKQQYPTIGRPTISEARPTHIYWPLVPIWMEKRETANQVRGWIETIIARHVEVDDADFRPRTASPPLQAANPARVAPAGIVTASLMTVAVFSRQRKLW